MTLDNRIAYLRLERDRVYRLSLDVDGLRQAVRLLDQAIAVVAAVRKKSLDQSTPQNPPFPTRLATKFSGFDQPTVLVGEQGPELVRFQP